MITMWHGLVRADRRLGSAKTALAIGMMVAVVLSACGGGGGSSSLPVVVVAPTVPTGLSLGYDVKAFKLSWAAVAPPAGGGAVTYRVTEDPDGAGPQAAAQTATDLTTTSHTQQVNGLLHTRLNATYTVQACNSAGCSALATPVAVDVKQAIGYFKASNSEAEDRFGGSVALSADGNTLAVGANRESSKSTGINGDQADNSAICADSTGTYGAGAVYVFMRSGGSWSQQAYVKASNTGACDNFGISVALSADGNTLAVGASFEGSNANGINGDQSDNSASSVQPVNGAGAVYVFTRAGTSWSQQAYVKASNTELSDNFGASLALSADGNTLAVGAPWESSNATGINGDQTNNLVSGAGAVYVFTRSGSNWSQQAYVKASNTHVNYIYDALGGFYFTAPSNFGASVALSADGTTLAVGATGEASNATGINGDQSFNGAFRAGAVYVFTRSGAIWSQQAYVKASNTKVYEDTFSMTLLGITKGGAAYFGGSVALSADGNTLAVGAYGESSNATGINGDQNNFTVRDSGAVYVFVRSAAVWSQQAYVKASNTTERAAFGGSVALSADGSTLAAGTSGRAVYVFTRGGSTWSERTYYARPGNLVGSAFGIGVALSAGATTLAVGDYRNAQADNSTSGMTGAVYLY